MNILKIIVGICSLLFFMVGADKFFNFLEPPCSLMNTISSTVWMVLGVLQIAGGILIWIPKYRKYVAGFFSIFMLFFIGVHIGKGTYDIGGAVLMAVLLITIYLNPKVLRGKEK
ncbi:MAG: hypothetical protein P1U56_15985 [Saprospiraceae bacterium]|nr:hypothetical protein [Saprospiraceae bacterium]